MCESAFGSDILSFFSFIKKNSKSGVEKPRGVSNYTRHAESSSGYAWVKQLPATSLAYIYVYARQLNPFVRARITSQVIPILASALHSPRVLCSIDSTRSAVSIAASSLYYRQQSFVCTTTSVSIQREWRSHSVTSLQTMRSSRRQQQQAEKQHP